VFHCLAVCDRHCSFPAVELIPTRGLYLVVGFDLVKKVSGHRLWSADLWVSLNFLIHRGLFGEGDAGVLVDCCEPGEEKQTGSCRKISKNLA
jgi:hypothetical protein